MINGFNFQALSSFAGQVIGIIGKPDPKGYSSAVKELHDPEVMNRILEDRISAIENDDTLSRDTKETLKNAVIDQWLKADIKHVQGCAEVTDREAENRGKLFNVILGGVLTGVALFGAAKGASYYIQNHTGQLRIEPRSTR